MPVKDTRGDTRRFSGLAQNASRPSSTTKVEEPKLTPEQVVAVFRSFGYEPNQNKMNDTGYWSTQPVSAMAKLMGDLKKRRDTDNSSFKTLSDNQIASIFKEYGFTPPDMNWVKGNLPLEEKKLRGILDIQRKSFNEELKETLRPQPKATPVPPMQPNAAMGMGGPANTILQASTDQGPSEPFFIGDTALVRIANQNNSGSPTLWLADNNSKTLRPIPESALSTLFEDPNAVQGSIVEVTTADLAPGGILQGFKMLGGKYGVRGDGTMEDIDFSPAQVSKRYGKAIDDPSEQRAVSVLDGLLGKLSSESTSGGVGGPYYDGQGGPGEKTYSYGITPERRDSDREQSGSTQLRGIVGLATTSGDIDPAFVSKLKNDPERMGFYLAALTYGGYTIGDIYNDMKRLEVASKGNDSAKTIRLISADLPRSQYINTPEGSSAQSAISGLFPKPSMMNSVDPNLFNYTVYNLPPQVFKELVPILDPKSEEFKRAMDKVKTGMYDIMLQQLQAKTEQDKAVADYNYDNFKKDVERQYGLQLSDNSDEAWKQIESLSETFSGRGLLGSGMHREALDEYLRASRRRDSRLREQRLTEEERRQASEFRASARPQDIQRIIEEDKARGLPQSEWRASKWGLIPSTSVANIFSIDALRAKFPELSTEEITRLRDTMIDEHGNYRSDIYRNYYKGIYENELGRKQYKEQEVYRQSLGEEEKAYREFTSSPDFMFSGTKKTESPPAATPPSSAPEINIPSDVISSAPTEYRESPREETRTVAPPTVSPQTNTSSGQQSLGNIQAAFTPTTPEQKVALDKIMAAFGTAASSGLYQTPKTSTIASSQKPRPTVQYSAPIGPVLPPQKASVANTTPTPSSELSKTLSTIKLPSYSSLMAPQKPSGLTISQTGSGLPVAGKTPSLATRLKNTVLGWFK